jgi:AraC-like DNA-binding protein
MSIDSIDSTESRFQNAAAFVSSDPQLYEQAASFFTNRQSATTLTAQVRIAVERLLEEGNCTPQNVSIAVGLHPRTLQRRLRSEGASVESIRDSVRRDFAMRYLQQPHVTLERLTELLGYSETSVLSRSCLRWFSASPRALRKDLKRKRQALGSNADLSTHIGDDTMAFAAAFEGTFDRTATRKRA